MPHELAPQQPAPGEQDSNQESAADELHDAIKAKLETAVQAGEHREARVDGSPYVNLQEAGDPDKAPGDIYRILEAQPAGGGESDTAVVVVDHLESEQPTLKFGELGVNDQWRDDMAEHGFGTSEEDEVIELKREYDVTRDSSEVRLVRELLAKDRPPRPEGHEGAWGWTQVVTTVQADSPELTEIAEQVSTLPVKEDVPSRGPVLPTPEAPNARR